MNTQPGIQSAMPWAEGPVPLQPVDNTATPVLPVPETRPEPDIPFSVNLATRALHAYAPALAAPDDSPEAVLTDLLTDLMHYADAAGIDFNTCFNSACVHWAAEVGK